MAAKTVLNFLERIGQLYEQGVESLRIGQYVKRWKSWATAGKLPVYGVQALSDCCQRLAIAMLSAVSESTPWRSLVWEGLQSFDYAVQKNLPQTYPATTT